MSLENKAKQILDNFDQIHSQEILGVLIQIKTHFQSKITQDYLEGKLKMISDTSDEDDRKILCSKLKPYFDWYLQRT